MNRSGVSLLFALLAACSDNHAAPLPQATSESSPSSSAPAEEARNAFNTLCATCHGQSGKGDGPAAATLEPKPRNYTDKAWQASVTDAQIKKIIVEGGAAVGKSPLMPAWTQFADKPDVLNELVKIVRSFGQ